MGQGGGDRLIHLQGVRPEGATLTTQPPTLVLCSCTASGLGGAVLMPRVGRAQEPKGPPPYLLAPHTLGQSRARYLFGKEEMDSTDFLASWHGCDDLRVPGLEHSIYSTPHLLQRGKLSK